MYISLHSNIFPETRKIFYFLGTISTALQGDMNISKPLKLSLYFSITSNIHE